MEYHLTALEILHLLEFTVSANKDRLKNLKQQYEIPLPKLYEDFMELAVDCPLFETANLWVGKMAGPSMFPYTLYDCLEEDIESEKEWWEKHPEDRKGLYAELAEKPKEHWQDILKNYLIFGSDYGAGIVQFGILMKDLVQNDPSFYVNWEGNDKSVWKYAGKLSDFLLHELLAILTNEDYETGEEALEDQGWKWEEAEGFTSETQFYAFCEEQGIDLDEIKKQQEVCSFTTPFFYCYDKENKILYIGSVQDAEEGRMALYAISPESSDYVWEEI